MTLSGSAALLGLCLGLGAAAAGCGSTPGEGVAAPEGSTAPGRPGSTAGPESPEETTTPQPSPQETPPLSSVPPPTLSRPPEAPTAPSDRISAVKVRGEVTAGTHPGCLELVTDLQRFSLVGELVAGLRPGDRVEVVGLPAPNLRSVCDGVVLRVRNVRPV